MNDHVIEEMAEAISRELRVDHNDVLRVLHHYWQDKIAPLWQVSDLLDTALNAGVPITKEDAIEVSSAQLILANLRRAGHLIKSFQQVAVDQSSEQAREIDLKTYLEEILVSLGPALKKTPHRVSIKCPENLRLLTYPGAISQIVVNLVMNSLIHEFEWIEHGEIRIECQSYDEEWLLLYRDNGVGMSEDVRQRVFDPFFTTKRGQGGSGLGLHVVYNLVTQLMRGSLDCISAPGKGVEFQIQLPRRVLQLQG